VREFFKKRFGYESELAPRFDELEALDRLDADVACSGYQRTRREEDQLLQVIIISQYRSFSFLVFFWFLFSCNSV
jgi:hypothetical protein